MIFFEFSEFFYSYLDVFQNLLCNSGNPDFLASEFQNLVLVIILKNSLKWSPDTFKIVFLIEVDFSENAKVPFN